ncbi:MAG: polysaccharide deacetylase family protein [Leptospirales bacterium]
MGIRKNIFRLFIIGLSSIFVWPVISKSAAKNSSPIDGNKAIIFCLHDIDGAGRYSITTDQLESIFKYLQNKFEVISLQEWKRKIVNKEVFLKHPVILTFDDGTPAVRKIVTPMLLKYNFGATLFIYINRYADHSTFFTFLKKLPASIEVGSHSFNHFDMKKLYKNDPKGFYKELFLSRKKLEYLIEKKVESFAWPYGSYAEEMVELARKAGYTIQVSTDYAQVNYEKDEILARFTLESKDPLGRVKKVIEKNFSGL